MKTLRIYLVLSFLSLFNALNSQSSPCSCKNDIDCICKNFDTLYKYARRAKSTICRQISSELNDIDLQSPKLVTNYTFRRTFINDFARVILQENSFASQVAHADLTIDENKSKVAFSPFVFHNRNLIYNPLRFFGSVEFTGSVDDDAVFKAFDKTGINRSFDIKLNFNYVPNWGNRNTFNREKDINCYKKFDALRKCALDKICEDDTKIKLLKDPCDNILDLTAALDELCDTVKLKKSVLDDFADVEQKLSKPFWTKSTKTWFSLSVVPYGYQEYAALDIYKKTLLNKDHYAPSGRIAVNRLINSLCNASSMYFNLWGELTWKNSFSDKTTTTWNYYHKFSDTTANVIESKSVYAYDSLTYTEKFLPNFGGQAIFICDNILFGVPVGLDLTAKVVVLPALRPGSGDYRKNTFTAGLIFPFNNKDDERVINLEVFYSWSVYSAKELQQEDFIGLKFSLPIFSR